MLKPNATITVVSNTESVELDDYGLPTTTRTEKDYTVFLAWGGTTVEYALDFTRSVNAATVMFLEDVNIDPTDRIFHEGKEYKIAGLVQDWGSMRNTGRKAGPVVNIESKVA